MGNENLTPEFLEKAKGKEPEEILEAAKSEGIELTDEQLERISGGWSSYSCPYCGSGYHEVIDDKYYTFRCEDCGRMFN